MQTWGYIQQAALAKLDLESGEAEVQNLLGRFYIFAHEAMVQICTSVKPKYTFHKFVITREQVNVPQQMPDDFISFNDDVSTEEITRKYITYEGEQVETEFRVLDDYDYKYYGNNQVVFFKPGIFNIAYNALWYNFSKGSNLSASEIIDAPDDVLNCLPSYIAHQCFKIDDEVKSSIYRNEYEMFLARIDNTHYQAPDNIVIGGGW